MLWMCSICSHIPKHVTSAMEWYTHNSLPGTSIRDLLVYKQPSDDDRHTNLSTTDSWDDITSIPRHNLFEHCSISYTRITIVAYPIGLYIITYASLYSRYLPHGIGPCTSPCIILFMLWHPDARRLHRCHTVFTYSSICRKGYNIF